MQDKDTQTELPNLVDVGYSDDWEENQFQILSSVKKFMKAGNWWKYQSCILPWNMSGKF